MYIEIHSDFPQLIVHHYIDPEGFCGWFDSTSTLCILLNLRGTQLNETVEQDYPLQLVSLINYLRYGVRFPLIDRKWRLHLSPVACILLLQPSSHYQQHLHYF